MNTTTLQPSITVFLPIYNGSRYLSETINSFLAQTYTNFELICIDDSSTDNSYQIVQEFASKDSRVRLFQKPNGGTVPKALNFALPYVRGEYVFYSSQDDLVSKDLLGNLYVRAKDTGADVIIPDMVWYYGDGNNSQGLFVPKDRIITGREAASMTIDWEIPGFYLLRASIPQRIKYYDFSLFSDEYTTRVFFLNCKTVAFCHGTFYYRVNNPNAITQKITLPLFDKLGNHERLTKLFNEYEATEEEKGKLANMTFIDLQFFQKVLTEKTRKLLSPNERKVAREKVKTAYNNFTDIGLVKGSWQFRTAFTKGYRRFVIFSWLKYNIIQKLKKSNA